jgi:anthranilate synthase component 1
MLVNGLWPTYNRGIVPDSDFQHLLRLARQQGATYVPVVRTVAADLLTPVAAFLKIAAKEPESFLLESVEGGEHVGRYSYLGVRPFMVVTPTRDGIEIRRGRKREQRKGDALRLLAGLMAEHKPLRAVAGLPPFTAGAVGFVAYDFVRRLERLPSTAKDDLHAPDLCLMFFDRVLAFDHVRQQIQIIATIDIRDGKSAGREYRRATSDVASIARKLAAGIAPTRDRRSRGKITVQPVTSKQDFLRSVRRAKEYIAAGDIFQVVLSQRWDLQINTEPFQIYRALRRVNPSPYMFYLRMGERQVLGSSPEMLVKVTGRNLEYRPIAGTRPRAEDAEEDRRREAELRADEKERAEHVMLVDLGRNDLGRVSDFGSVQVRELMMVERYSHVMHLVSSLESRLRPELGPLDAFASCFPAGTLSGAPKVRAMEIIEELEPVRRGIYGGAVLYADFAGDLNSCISIRTMVVEGKKARVQAGAGIVADSDPEKEFEECVSKAGALLRAVEESG